MNYASWYNLTDDQIAKRGIAEMHFAAASGLPLPHDIEVADLRNRLDEWCELVDYGIRRMEKRRGASDQPDLTSNQYRIMVMITVLQRNLGVTYNWAFSQGEYNATDSRNLFLHGILSGHGGTCVSMPSLYAAVGRRLGFPIKIVLAKQHSFCRWDGEERFNIEATSPGFNSRPDEHYRMWPIPITQSEVDAGRFLKSLTPTEELAYFIGQRGNCLFDLLQTQRACEAHGIAHHLVPDDPGLDRQWGLSLLLHRTIEHLREQRRTYPHALHVPLLAPQNAWERVALPRVYEHLDRIFRNRQKHKANRVHEQAFQKSLA